MTDRTKGWLIAAVTLFAIILVMWLSKAMAQDSWLPGTRCEWKFGKERCARRHRSGVIEYHWTGRERSPLTRVHSFLQEDRGRCRAIVQAVGEEKYGIDRAKEAALSAWMEAVRREPGARYMDPKNARHLSYECGRSSTGNRASEKTAESVGKFLEQCEVRAQPCRPDRDDSTER